MANGSYSAGNLEFVAQQISEKTISSLDTLIARLQTTMNLLGSVSTLSKNIGTTVGKASSSSVSSNKGDSLSKQTASARLTKTINNDVAQINASVKKMSTKSLTDIVNKVYFWHNYTKQLFKNLTGVVKLAVDYAETLNLWQVAMRGYREEAEDFVASMNKAYGIATQTLMQYQAVFRNMLSSLGGINESVSYQLSEYLTQMALDYASLYNTSIERAMTTFQSVLSGQVRPIRSIAGYDITETTIYQLYQQLGGTKTMRQLTQTEKRLLRIYAVFNQMESSGAVNDLAKTIGSTANQMRIFTESTKELGTWLGITLEMYIKPILPYLNAFVITLTNVAKAYARMKGYKPVEYGAVESVQELNEALDETQGKLLSFDRFEALNSGEQDSNLLGIDESLLAGLSQYSSVLSEVTGKAQELAERWTNLFVDENTGELTELSKVLMTIVSTLGILIAYRIGAKLITLIKRVSGLTTGLKLLNFALLTGTIYAFGRAVEAFKEGDYWAGILASVIGTVLVGALIYMNRTILISVAQAVGKTLVLLFANAYASTLSLSGAIGILTLGFGALVGAVAGAFLLIKNWGSMETWQKVIGVIGTVTTAVLGLAMAMGVFHSAWSIGVASAGIIAGIGMMVASIASVKKEIKTPIQYKTGGLVEDGLFQMSRGEIIGEFDDGTTRVANNQQITKGIEDASYRGYARAIRDFGGNSGGDVYLGKDKVGKIIAKSSYRENVRTGLVKVSTQK